MAGAKRGFRAGLAHDGTGGHARATDSRRAGCALTVAAAVSKKAYPGKGHGGATSAEWTL
jgi:hypothetical protein